MAKLTYTLALLALSAGAAAQGYPDALRFNNNELTGTARSQAMAGAYGAVGADLSAMTINPAGMGLYRATEMGFSLGVNVVKSKSEYFGATTEDDRVRVPFSQAGVGISFGRVREDETGLVRNNIFLGYNRLADYSRTVSHADPYAHNSLLDYFCLDEQLPGGITGDLGFQAYLTNDTVNGAGQKMRYNVWEHLYDGALDPAFRVDQDGLGLINLKKTVKETGSKGEFTVGYAANIANKLYVGASVDIVALWLEQTTKHQEAFEGYVDETQNPGAPLNFAYVYRLDQDGCGVNFRLGLIYRPVPALRVGFAITSPTFFNIKEKFSASIDNPSRAIYHSDDYDYDYRYRAPSRFTASLCGTFGKGGMLSVDYERCNYKRSKFREKDDGLDDLGSDAGFDDVNEALKHGIMTSVNTLRVGGELSVLNPVYLRAGYRMTTPGIKKDYYFTKPVDFAISGGIGLRLSNFFVDLTYVGNVRKGDDYVLPDSAEPYFYEDNVPAKLTEHVRRGVLTFGFRF